MMICVEGRVVSRDTIITREYHSNGYFCKSSGSGTWLSGPWRTKLSATLAAEGKYEEARQHDKLDWRKAKRAAKQRKKL